MIFKKYVVCKGTYDRKPVAVCDCMEDAEDVARCMLNIEDASEYVSEVMYIRSKQTVAREALYDMQNGVVTIPTRRGEVINAEL